MRGAGAAGGAGLMMVESTKVEQRGCGTMGDLGLWVTPSSLASSGSSSSSGRRIAWRASRSGILGRKARRFRPWEGGAPLTRARRWSRRWGRRVGRVGFGRALGGAVAGERPAAARPVAHGGEGPRSAVGPAARRAQEAGFEVLEIHGAHVAT